MDWVGCFEKGALINLIIAVSIIVLVGYAHGARRNMSLFDPVLKNKISPFGISCLRFSGLLIFLSVLFAAGSVWLNT